MQVSSTLFSPSTWRRGLIAGVVAFAVTLALQLSGALRPLENHAQDHLRKVLALPYQAPIEVVYLDDVSLRMAEDQFQLKFPWPRETYANAVDFLRSAGAKAIVFDFLFTSASSYGDDDDKLFVRAAQRHGKVIVGMEFTSADQPDARKAFFAQTPLYQLPAMDATVLVQAHGVNAPKPPLWGAFAGIGDTSFDQDSDSLGRSGRLAIAFEGRAYPSLALSAALELGAPLPDLAREQRPLLLFRQPKGVANASRLYDVAVSWINRQDGLKPLVDPARFKDKVVLIGTSAPGLLDLRPTPMGKNMPGVELQAMELDNLLTGEHLQALPMSWPYWLLILAACLAIASLSFRLPKLASFLPAFLGTTVSYGVARWAYQDHHVLMPVVLPAAAAWLAFLIAAFENFVIEQGQRRKVTGVFGQFLSPAVLDSLRQTGGKLQTGGESRPMTVYFSDLQGFTSFSEKLSPERLVEILNFYLTEMGEVIVGQHDGTVDKYIGDAIMAFWNAPVEQTDHAYRGCAAAWHCQQKLAEIQPDLAAIGLVADGDEGLVMRIGLNTGPAVAGLMGSPRKLNYTVMGDTVNTASRLEGANKPYGSRILLSQATKDAAGKRVLTRPLDYVKVKGKKEATPLFEMIGLEGSGKALYAPDYVDAWTVALADYKRGDFGTALTSFQGCAAAQPKDKACALFIERCQHFLHEPPAAWDGVYEMKTK